MWKDPRGFSKLGKVEWRHIEQPSFPMRMRAMCNQLKAALLSDKHDPFKIQTLDVLNTGKAPVEEEITWQRWWGSQSIPQTSQLATCDDISPGARRWIEFCEKGNPLQRHMLALDSIGIELTRDGEWGEAKIQAQNLSLESLKQVWSKFTHASCVSPNSPLSFGKQIFNAVLPPASLTHATPEDRKHLVIHDANPYQYEFAEKTRQQYNDSDKFGLFRFLQSVKRETKLQQAWLKDTWILDMATLVACMRSEMIPSPAHYSSGFGQLNYEAAFWMRLFWNSDEGADSLLISLTKNQPADIRDEFISQHLEIRSRYYELFSQYGISASDVLHFTFIDHDKSECFN